MLSAESEASFTQGAAERQRASGWTPPAPTSLYHRSGWTPSGQGLGRGRARRLTLPVSVAPLSLTPSSPCFIAVRIAVSARLILPAALPMISLTTKRNPSPHHVRHLRLKGW